MTILTNKDYRAECLAMMHAIIGNKILTIGELAKRLNVSDKKLQEYLSGDTQIIIKERARYMVFKMRGALRSSAAKLGEAIALMQQEAAGTRIVISSEGEALAIPAKVNSNEQLTSISNCLESLQKEIKEKEIQYELLKSQYSELVQKLSDAREELQLKKDKYSKMLSAWETMKSLLESEGA